MIEDWAYQTDKLVLVPYVRGSSLFPADMLFQLWKLAADDGTAWRLAWGQLCDEEGQRGDLTFFMDAVAKSQVLLFVAKSDGELRGFVWLEDIREGHRATCGLFHRRKGLRATAVEMITLGCDYVFKEFGLESLWAYTPFRNARRVALRAGFHHVATLEDYVRVRGKSLHVHILRKRHYEHV